MLSKIVVLGIVVLILILVACLVRDTVNKGVKDLVKNKVPKVINNVREDHSVKVTNSPVLYIKFPGERSYQTVQVEKKVVKIGRDEKNDVVLDDETVDLVHARLEKKVKGDQVFYELINLSKVNPIEHFKVDIQDYRPIGCRHGVVLDTNEAFFIGNTKMVIKFPSKGHEPSKTERIIFSSPVEKENDSSKELSESEQMINEKATVRFEKAQKTRVVSGDKFDR